MAKKKPKILKIPDPFGFVGAIDTAKLKKKDSNELGKILGILMHSVDKKMKK